MASPTCRGGWKGNLLGKERKRQHLRVSEANVLWERVALSSVFLVALGTFIPQEFISVFEEPRHAMGTEAKAVTSI